MDRTVLKECIIYVDSNQKSMEIINHLNYCVTTEEDKLSKSIHCLLPIEQFAFNKAFTALTYNVHVQSTIYTIHVYNNTKLQGTV